MQINRSKLEIAMAKRRINFAQLSAASGVSRVTLSYIRGGKSCSPDTVGKIAVGLGVSVEQLIEQED